MRDDLFRVEELPRCLSNWRSFSYSFGSPISSRFACRLLELGDGELRQHYPRPLLKVREAGHFYLVGVVGTCRIKVDYNESEMETTKNRIESCIVRAWQSICAESESVEDGT